MIRSWRWLSTALSGGFQDLAQLEPVPLALVYVGGWDVPVERLVLLGPLDSLADHVDGADEFTTLRRIIRQDQGQIELAFAGLGEEPAADLLGAIVPEAGVQSSIPPAGGAITLDVPDEVRLGRLGGQGSEPDDQCDGGRSDLRVRGGTIGLFSAGLARPRGWSLGGFDLHELTVSHHAPIYYPPGG